MPLTENSIERVVDNDLCLRCGACEPVCPVEGCITLGEDLYPRVDPGTCIECGVCLTVCPGESLDIDAMKESLESAPHPHDVLGGIHQPFVGHAADPDARGRGSAGGFVTELLARLLESGTIDGAVVAGWSSGKPWKPEQRLARTPGEVRSAAGSKYTAVPMTTVMDEVIGRGGDRYAFVGVSCQVHALRLMTRARPHLREKVPYVVGLFCSSMFDERAITDLLRAAGVAEEEVAGLGYREGPWPGVIRARTRDGASRPLHPSNYKDGAYNYLTPLYTQPRCWQCFDWSNELADLAAADPWGRDEDGGYRYPEGRTLLLPRTPAGVELMRFASSDPTLRVEHTDPDYVRVTGERMAGAKRRTARAEMDRRRRRGLPYARYDRELPELTLRQRVGEGLRALPRIPGKFPGLRFALLRFLVSRAGAPLLWLRQLRKYGFQGFARVRRHSIRVRAHGGWAGPKDGSREAGSRKHVPWHPDPPSM